MTFSVNNINYYNYFIKKYDNMIVLPRVLLEEGVGVVTGITVDWLLFVAGEFALPVLPNGFT